MKNYVNLLQYRDSVYAPDLLICATTHFDFFTYLQTGPKTFDSICDRFNITGRPADVMLTLFSAMNLVNKDSNMYEATEISKKYLTSGSECSLIPYYASLKDRPQCREFSEVLRTGKPAGWSGKDDGDDWISSMKNREFADAFTAAMDSRGTLLAGKLVDKIDLSGKRALLDIAGGSGIYSCSLSGRYPDLRADVLEIPPINRAAKRSIQNKGMGGRVGVITGDMFEKIPAGYDVHLFANTLHDWNCSSNRILISNSYASLNKGGKIIVFDAHLNDTKTGPLSVAEYSCLLMHSTEGRCYSKAEIRTLLEEAGFTGVHCIDISAGRSAIIGQCP